MSDGHDALKVVDAFDLDDELRTILKPGEMVKDAQMRRHRLPRYFYEVPSHDFAMTTRLTTHFDLDFPRHPTLEPYFCHKHKRICRPVGAARQFLRRYADDTLARIREFGRLRARSRTATVLHADARTVAYDRRFDGIVVL